MNFIIFVIAIITLLIDQLTKIVISVSLKLGESITLIPNLLNFTYKENSGAAWGILSGYRFVLIIFSLIGLILVIRYIHVFKRNKRNNLAFGLLLAGISGNLIDRILFGYVRDFIAFKIIDKSFPVFNIADMAIISGIILLIIAIIKGEDENEDNS